MGNKLVSITSSNLRACFTCFYPRKHRLGILCTGWFQLLFIFGKMGWQTLISQWENHVCVSKSRWQEHLWVVCISRKEPLHCGQLFLLMGCLLHPSREDSMSSWKRTWLFFASWNHSASITALLSVASVTQDDLDHAQKPMVPGKWWKGGEKDLTTKIILFLQNLLQNARRHSVTKGYICKSS